MLLHGLVAVTHLRIGRRDFAITRRPLADARTAAVIGIFVDVLQQQVRQQVACFTQRLCLLGAAGMSQHRALRHRRGLLGVCHQFADQGALLRIVAPIDLALALEARAEVTGQPVRLRQSRGIPALQLRALDQHPANLV